MTPPVVPLSEISLQALQQAKSCPNERFAMILQGCSLAAILIATSLSSAIAVKSLFDAPAKGHSR